MKWGKEIMGDTIYVGPMRADGRKLYDIAFTMEYGDGFTEEANKRILDYANQIIGSVNARATQQPKAGAEVDVVVLEIWQEFRDLLRNRTTVLGDDFTRLIEFQNSLWKYLMDVRGMKPEFYRTDRPKKIFTPATPASEKKNGDVLRQPVYGDAEWVTGLVAEMEKLKRRPKSPKDQDAFVITENNTVDRCIDLAKHYAGKGA